MGLGSDGLKLGRRPAWTRQTCRITLPPTVWPPLTRLRAQLIIPYVVLTLLTTLIGTYVVTRLLTSSVRERFINQLHEAGRVAADGIVRRERAQLANLRLMVFTQGAHTADLETILKTTTRTLSQALGTTHAFIRLGALPPPAPSFEVRAIEMDSASEALTVSQRDSGRPLSGTPHPAHQPALASRSPGWSGRQLGTNFKN